MVVAYSDDYKSRMCKKWARNTWVQADGKKIKWKDMTSAHLRNAARMLERNVAAQELALGRGYSLVQSEQAQLAILAEMENCQEGNEERRFLATSMRDYACWRELHEATGKPEKASA